MEIEAMVTPGARKEKIVRKAEGKYEIAVREEAARNEANMRVREIIAAALGVPENRVRMIRGARSKKKFFKINA